KTAQAADHGKGERAPAGDGGAGQAISRNQTRSKRIVLVAPFNGDLPQFREFRDPGLPAKATIAARLDAAKSDAGLITHRWTVDMAHAGCDALGNFLRARHVLTEDGCRQA